MYAGKSSRSFGARILSCRRRWQSSSSWTVQQVERGMEEWIENIVVRMGMCPFAAKSNYRIHVNTTGTAETTEERQRWIIDHATKLANFSSPKNDDKSIPTAILVFPDLEGAEAQQELLTESVKLSNGLIGSNLTDVEANMDPREMEQYVMEALKTGAVNESNLDQFVQNIIESNFRLPAKENTSAILSVPFFTPLPKNNFLMIQALAPWYTIQLFRREDMIQARGKGHKVQTQIIRHNEQLDKQMDNHEKRSLLYGIRNRAATEDTTTILIPPYVEPIKK